MWLAHGGKSMNKRIAKKILKNLGKLNYSSGQIARAKLKILATAKPFGNSAHVILPRNLRNKKVVITTT